MERSSADLDVDVIALVPDLLFASRISSLAKSNARSLSIASSLAELRQLLANHRPRLVIVDLSARGVDVAAAIGAAKAANVPTVVAFGPHKDLAARAAALDAGADRWVTNQRLVDVMADLWDS